MTRTAFLVDGFNLYHSLKDASFRLGLQGAGTLLLLPVQPTSFELKALAHRSFRVAKERYARHQLPDPVVLPDGRRVAKPARW